LAQRIDRRDFLVQAAGALAASAIISHVAHARLRLDQATGVGIIGCGRQGRAIIAELLSIEGVTIPAACDVDDGRLRSALRRAQGIEGVADYRALLDRKDVSAVCIATPTHLHKQIALDAIAAGKHVYCEAPIAHTVDDCRAIARAARGAKVVFASGLQGRSNPVYKLAWTFFRSDAVRDLVAMQAQSMQKTTWRSPASDAAREKAFNWRLDPEVSLGLAGELGTQQFDVLHWYTGRYPVSVAGNGSIRAYNDGRQVPDTIALDLAFERGERLQYLASIAATYGREFEVLWGTNATIKLAWSHGWMFKEADAPTQGWEVYANRQQFHNDEGITLIADATKLASQGKLKEGVGLPFSSLYYALGNFLEATTGSAEVACSADEGARATIVGIHAARAVREGVRVEIPPDALVV
jgi:predicted dehydrogenase